METTAFLRFLLRRRTLLIVLFLLTWLILLDLLWLVPTQEGIRIAASDLSVEIADNAASNVSSHLSDILTRAQNAALDIYAEPDRTQKVLDRLIERDPAFINAVLINQDGSVMARSGQFQDADNAREYSKLSGTYLALAGSASFSDVSLVNGHPTSLVSVPVVSPDGVHSIIVAEVDLSDLAETIAPPKTGTWHIFITNRNGLEIIGPSESSGQTNFIIRPIVQRVAVDGQTANGLAPEDTYLDTNGVRVFAVGIPIPVSNWSLFVERPESEAMHENTIVVALALAILALGLAAIGVALWSFWRQTKLNDQLFTQGKELLEKNVQLQELNRVKSDFISVAAHQLRTPLSALKWALDILLNEDAENLTSEQRSLLLKGFESNERMLNLINEMLIVTRMESGKEHFAFAPLHIEDLIENIIIDFTGQAYVRKMSLTFNKPPERMPLINADPDKMRAVIQNLIENAMRYTDDGGSIRLSAELQGAMIRVSVADSGIGIPEREKPNIFNKFYRADNAMKKHTDGSGLGLYIAKSIVEKHGGTIDFTSVQGKGTTFSFTVPVSNVG